MSLEKELKNLIEKLSPDLRAHMRLSLSGIVTKVHEDDYRVDVEIPGDDDEVLSLPFIPVKSPMALDGSVTSLSTSGSAKMPQPSRAIGDFTGMNGSESISSSSPGISTSTR